MPVISRRALAAGRHLFGETISGWGLDLALGRLVTEQLGGRAAVFDDIVAEHGKPVDLAGGAFYRMLAGANIDPDLECRYLRRKFGTEGAFAELPLSA